MALQQAKGNLEDTITLCLKAEIELLLWIKNTKSASKPLIQTPPQLIITTEASLHGWGAVCKHSSTGGPWSIGEGKRHINHLEMLAVLFGLRTFSSTKGNIHVRVMTDNTSTVAILNHVGTSHSMSCTDLCKSIWEWCLKGSIWLSVVHIPGKANIRADIESRRKYSSSSERMMNTLLSCSEQLSVQPNIDLFASRLNNQLDCFVSFKPDPYSYAIDAFALDWGKYVKWQIFYIFPPFSLVPRVLSKIQMDHAEGVCVLRDWPT